MGSRRSATSIEYTRTPAGRPGRYARHLLVSRQVNVRPLLSAVLPIERFADGLDLLRRREAIKVTFDVGNEGG
jgi:hypothetical protein